MFDVEAHALAFRGDTLDLVIAEDHGRLLVYEANQGEEPVNQLVIAQPWTYTGAQVMQFRDQGRRLAVLFADGNVVLFDAETGDVLRHASPPPGRPLWRAVTDADWSIFAAATSDGVVIWPGETREPGARADDGRDPGSS